MAVLSAVGGQGREPVTHGFSGAGVWRLDDRFLKVGARVGDEAARTAWLAAAGLPAPAVLDAGTAGTTEWLVTAAIAGRPAHAPWPADRRDTVVAALARITAALHALPVAECPFDRSLADPALNPQFGPAHGAAYLRGCSESLDPERIAFHRLLDESA